LDIPELRGKEILLHMSNTLLEASVKLKTSSHWMLHYGKYNKNHSFQLLDSFPIMMDLNLSYNI